MTVSISTDPLYPVPGRECLVSFSSDDSSANHIKVFCTAAPEGSDEAKRLADASATSIVIFEGSLSDSWKFAPAVGGKYSFTSYESDKGASANGGSYQFDAESYSSEVDQGSNSVSVYVGSRMTTKLGVSPDTSTLAVWVFNDTIRQTRVDAHGERTPAISEHKTQRAESAATSTAVETAVEALQDVTATVATGDIGAAVDDVIDQYRAHIASATVHYSADTDNAISTARLNPESAGGISGSVNELLSKMARHMMNDDGSGVGTETWHQLAGSSAADLTTGSIASLASASDGRSRVAALADAWRVYEAHRSNATVHQAADSTNACAALPAIANIHRLYLGALASADPPTPQTANPGATALLFAGGFSDG